jgi:hypothetical protein
MKPNHTQQTLKWRWQYALRYLKKKAGHIRRAYQGQVRLAWYSDEPLKIQVIERPLDANGPLHAVDEPPPYSAGTKVLQKFMPQDVVRCLKDSAQTLYEISHTVSQEVPRSGMDDKNRKRTYGEMAARLRETVGRLQEMRASELNELVSLIGEDVTV